jgi:hypothetical protein
MHVLFARNKWLKVSEGTYTAGAGLFDLTTANAFVGLNNTFINVDTTLSGVTMNISRVAGADFITNPSSDLTGYVGQVMKINDGTGKYLYVKPLAAGTGEALGEELLLSWTNHPTQGFDTFTTAGREVSSAIELTSGGRAYAAITTTVGALYKVTPTGYTLNTGTAPRWGAFQLPEVTTGDGEWDRYYDASGPVEFYFTKKVAAYIGLRAVFAATNFAVTDTSVKQVTAPSATGVTFEYISVDSGFNYNATSFTIQISNGLSAYQDGKHLLWASDGTNTLLARISATAPGGETLDVELVTDGAMSTAIGAGTWTSPGNWSIGAGVATYDDLATNYMEQTIAAQSSGILYKVTFDIGGAIGKFLLTNQTGGISLTPPISYNIGSYIKYQTVSAAVSGLRCYGFTDQNSFTLDNLSAKRVTDCAATGALLESTKGGARGFISLPAAFNGNLAGTYRILRSY